MTTFLAISTYTLLAHSKSPRSYPVRFTQEAPPLVKSRREAADLPAVTILLHHHQHIHVPVPPPPPSSHSTSTTASGKVPVRTRGRQHVPFLQVNPSAEQRWASPLLQDVVPPLEAAGLIAATLAASPRKWRGVALLPLRADTDSDVGSSSGTWQDVGYRMRDLRIGRGKYVRLDLR